MIAVILIAICLALGLAVHKITAQHPRNHHRHFGL